MQKPPPWKQSFFLVGRPFTLAVRPLFLLLFASLAAVLALSGQFTPQEIAERPRWEKFLEEADITGSVQLGIDQGVTEPWKLTLEKDGATRNALWKNPSGILHGFRESWKYEIAAYKFDKHFELDMVPPTVEKSFRGSPGSCQLWIEDTALLREKIEEGLEASVLRTENWMRRGYLQQAFDNLIGNEDRHAGNVLITSDHRPILIDHSRTFRTSRAYTEYLPFSRAKTGVEVMCELPRAFVAKIRALDEAAIRAAVGDYLTSEEIGAILVRKKLLLAEIDLLVSKYGEGSVLY